jgi:rare lipoprotein A
MRPYTVLGKTYYPTKVSIGDSFSGIASWYGPNFHNKLTSNGEYYNMYAMTAAHKTLPMNTMLKVTNLENGKVAIVRINDRGPFVKNRIIDVSKKAASILGFQKKGTANVIVEYYGRAKIYDKNGKIVKQKLTKNIKNDKGLYFVRIGIFSDVNNIDNIISQVRNLAKIRVDKSQLGHKVLLGPFANKNYTERVLNIIKEKGFKDAIIEKIK